MVDVVLECIQQPRAVQNEVRNDNIVSVGFEDRRERVDPQRRTLAQRIDTNDRQAAVDLIDDRRSNKEDLHGCSAVVATAAIVSNVDG